MPATCVPWPGNSHSSDGSSAACTGAVDARSAAAASAASRATTLRRQAKPRRPRASVYSTASSGGASLSSRAASACDNCSSACGLRADRRSSRGVSPSPAAAAAGASSTTTSALVPPMPKELTPARRGAPAAAGHGASAVARRKGPDASSSAGLGSSACSVGGICRWRSASTALISPAMPAAASRWPMLLFTEPSAHEPGAPPRPKARVSAATSTGSPSRVPVPCASTRPMLAASTPAAASAASITAHCRSRLGAVKLCFSAPSLLTAEPLITACTVSPAASASSSRRSTTTPTPLPGTVPAASAAKARQWPSGAWMPPGGAW